MDEFKYEVVTYVIFAKEDSDKMAKDIEDRFNKGWKPTTNGPVLALMMDKHIYPAVMGLGATPNEAMVHSMGSLRETVEQSTWFLMYVFAKERLHDHHN